MLMLCGPTIRAAGYNKGSMPNDDDHPKPWAFLTDDELETLAPDYIWGAETGDETERLECASLLNHVVAEAQRRGKPEIIDRARASVVHPDNPR